MNAEDRKKHILNCAKKLFSQHGYYKTQISDIINDAGIARGTVYQYFTSKDDIFVTLIENFYHDWEQSIALNLGNLDLKSISPKSYISHRIKNTLAFLEADRDLCNIVLRMGIGLHRDFDALMQRFEKKIINLITGDLELGIQFGSVRKDLNMELTANIMAGALFRVSYHYFVQKKSAPNDLDTITSEILDIFLPGIFVSKKK
jgi:AcrR family transcriptional regulator